MNYFKLAFCILSFLSVGLLVYSQSDSVGTFSCYNIKSCKVIYKFFDGIRRGEKIVIFDDSGVYEKEIVIAHLVSDSIMEDSPAASFIKKDINMIAIKTPQSILTVDIDTKRGSKQDRRPLPFGKDFFTPDKKVIGSDTILGRRCEIIEYTKAYKVWYWKGIALKKEMVVDGIIIQECAISIDESYSIKKDEFNVPKDVVWQNQ